MANQVLLACGVGMPVIYSLMLLAACSFNPGFNLLRQEPSALGRADAVYPMIYNIGMVATAVAGLLAGGALIVATGIGRRSAWNICAGATIFLSSVGLAMAGLFPLPSPLHNGFGLTAAAMLTPLFGAASFRKSGRHAVATLLFALFVLIAVLVVGKAPPLLPGALMLITVAFLSWTMRRGSQMTVS